MVFSSDLPLCLTLIAVSLTPPLSLRAGFTVSLSPLFVSPCLCPSVSQCPEKNVRPPHMRAFNKAVAVVFNSSGDDNCGLCDGSLKPLQ